MAIVDQIAGTKFGRTADKSRVPTFFEFSNDAVDDLPTRYRYDKATSDWVETSITGFTSALLSTTVQSLGLTGPVYASSAQGTQTGSKTWKVKVLTAIGNVTRDAAGVPSGSPATFTYFSIPVPSWVNTFLFAHSVFKALFAEASVFISDGSNEPVADDIVAFISPGGRTYSGAAMNRLFVTVEPPA